MPAETRLFRCLNDNYGVLLHDPETGATAAIDAPEAAPVEAALKADRLEAHRHPGHPPSRRPHRRHPALKEKYKCRVVAPAEEAGENPGGRRDRARGRQGEGRQAVRQRDRDARPHARPHRLLVPRRQARLRRRHAVLDRLRPRDRGHAGDDVGIRSRSCATCRTTPKSIAGTNTPPPISNSRAPSSRTTRCWPRAKRRRSAQIEKGQPTIPVTIGDEKLANPFLRADVPEVAAGIGMAGKPAAQVFAEIRARKNKF